MEHGDTEDAQANGDDAEVAWKTASRTNQKEENDKNRPEGEDENAIGDVEPSGGKLEIVRGNGQSGKSDLNPEHYAKEDPSPRIDILAKDDEGGDDDRIGDESLDVQGEGVGNLKDGDQRAVTNDHAGGIEKYEDAEVKQCKIACASAEEKHP